MSQGIENLAGLIGDAGDGREFFSRNFVTRGMEQLFREGLLRLSGKSDQAVFELSQAMGGGKTHMMVALGLLARHPHLRAEVLPPELAERLDFGNARIAAFNGRNNPDNFIWGEIAQQLGEAEAIKPFWANGPRSVDQQAWKEIIGDRPTLIMLDELPPYLDNATTHVYGRGTLATMVTYSLGTLMSAALELPNCCIVIANLSGSYRAQTRALAETISNLQQETRRQAVTITPVQLAGNKIDEIMKKRLIDEMPDERVIADVAEEYAQEVKKAEDGGYVTAASLEQIAEQVRETYPFHPSFKHLVALFKENEGFRQTRGLMQFTARYREDAIGLYAGAGRSRLYQKNESVAIERETLKKMVAEHQIKLMVATDAACEGLNLQTLGALINVDLPWKPTRLEQRIGRIKRFGQVRDTVDMLNLVNEQTVDQMVYERLAASTDRLRIFIIIRLSEH